MNRAGRRDGRNLTEQGAAFGKEDFPELRKEA